MSDISSIGQGVVGPLNRAASHANHHSNGVATRDDRADVRGDRVELSDHARLLDRLRKLPAVRAERVETLRELIAAGNYETDDKIDLAIERLLDDLGSEK